MEFMSESSRFEHGGLARECEAALVVAALQGLFLLPEELGEDEESNER